MKAPVYQLDKVILLPKCVRISVKKFAQNKEHNSKQGQVCFSFLMSSKCHKHSGLRPKMKPKVKFY